MKVLDWVAILGALAWLPHFIKYAQEYFSKPKLRLITGVAPEVGFTTFGPILNLRMAFVVERKDLVISSVKIRLKHESGDEQTFAWQGFVQSLGRMTYPQIGHVPFEKESSVLALKARTSDVDERFIRFQEIGFIKNKQEIEQKASKRLMYLRRQSGKLDSEAFLKCEEMTDLYLHIKRSFPWKEGVYSLIFEVGSPQPFFISGHVYKFNLSSADVEELEKNREQVERSYRDQFILRQDDEPELFWVWRYPELKSVAT